MSESRDAEAAGHAAAAESTVGRAAADVERVTERGYTVRITDGGRSRHFRAAAGDCGARALTLATGLPYDRIYAECADTQAEWALSGEETTEKMNAATAGRTSRNGIFLEALDLVAVRHGWVRRHISDTDRSPVLLRDDRMPRVPVVACITRHVTYWNGAEGLDTGNPLRRTGHRRAPGVRDVYHHVDDTAVVDEWLAAAGAAPPPVAWPRMEPPGERHALARPLDARRKRHLRTAYAYAAVLAAADHGDSRVRAAWEALAWSKRQRTKFLDPQYYTDALAGRPPERAAQVVLVILDDHRRRAHRLGTTTRQGALLSDVLGDIAAHVRDEFCGGD